MSDWLNTPLNQMQWWQLVIIGLAWLALAGVIFELLMFLETVTRRIVRRLRRRRR